MDKLWLHLVVGFVGVGLRAVAAADAPAPLPVPHPRPAPPLHWIQLHAWFMWTSFGFLMPAAIILMRYSRSQTNPTGNVSNTRARTLFYAHVLLQTLAVGFAAAGFAVLWTTQGNVLDHTHERLGFTVVIIALVMPFIGLARPSKGARLRTYWLFVHWSLGTAAVILGITNIFIGIWIYQFILLKKIPSLNMVFSISVAFVGLLYVLQDRLSYILSQGKPQGPESPNAKLPGAIAGGGIWSPPTV
jgi:hypothetical protein